MKNAFSIWFRDAGFDLSSAGADPEGQNLPAGKTGRKKREKAIKMLDKIS